MYNVWTANFYDCLPVPSFSLNRQAHSPSFYLLRHSLLGIADTFSFYLWAEVKVSMTSGDVRNSNFPSSPSWYGWFWSHYSIVPSLPAKIDVQPWAQRTWRVQDGLYQGSQTSKATSWRLPFHHRASPPPSSGGGCILHNLGICLIWPGWGLALHKHQMTSWH